MLDVQELVESKMKYRNGFVSNSSSSSFIVAVKQVESDDGSPSWFNFLNLLIENTGGQDRLKSFSSAVSDQIAKWQEEVEELKLDRDWAIEKAKIYEDITAIDVALPLLAKLIEHEDRYPHPEIPQSQLKWRLRGPRETEEYSKETPLQKAKESLQWKKDSIRMDISRARKSIDSLIEKIKKAEPYNSNEWTLIRFEEDNWGGVLTKAVEQLVKSNQAIIIEKQTY